MMPEGERLRGLVTARLTAAAEDIFKLVKTTTVEYEEELERQRELLDIFLNPKVYLHRKDEPHQLVCEEEVALFDQEKKSSPDPEEAQPSWIKEEPEEPCSIQEGEQLELKEETDTFMLTPAHEERESEPELHEQHLLSSLRELVIKRQTAAAEDICQLVKTTIVEYKKEIKRQQKLLEIILNPVVYLHRIDVQQQLVCKEEGVLLCKQVCSQERKSSPDQEEAEPPPMKEEPEESCSIQEEKQLELKEETDTFTLTPDHEGRGHSEPELHEQQPLSDSSHVSEDEDPAGSMDKDSESSRKSEPNFSDRIHQSSHNVDVSENQQPSFKCGICGGSFRSKLALNTHQRAHSGQETHSCEICGKVFIWKSVLRIHIRRHTSERPYTCTLCSKSFAEQQNLKVHMRVHTGERPFTCTTCSKSFTHDLYLKAHMRTHTGERPFTCTTCSKSFSQKKYLKQHMRTHTDEKPFTCTTCGKSFKQPHYLKAHMRIHTGEKPYSCSTCGKGLTCVQSMKNHIKMHTRDSMVSEPHMFDNIRQSSRNTGVSGKPRKPSFKCGVCGKSFKSVSALNTHQRAHSGKKTHSCEICGKVFIRQYLLSLHVRDHVRRAIEKPFPCTTCSKSFRQKQNLKFHMFTHTGVKPSLVRHAANVSNNAGVEITHTSTHR